MLKKKYQVRTCDFCTKCWLVNNYTVHSGTSVNPGGVYCLGWLGKSYYAGCEPQITVPPIGNKRPRPISNKNGTSAFTPFSQLLGVIHPTCVTAIPNAKAIAHDPRLSEIQRNQRLLLKKVKLYHKGFRWVANQLGDGVCDMFTTYVTRDFLRQVTLKVIIFS